MQPTEQRSLTEAVERGAHEHEDVTLGAAECMPVLVRQFVRRDEQAEASDADDDALHANQFCQAKSNGNLRTRSWVQ